MEDFVEGVNVIVSWDHTDPYPRDMAYFVKQVATHDSRQSELLREWLMKEFQKVIKPDVKQGMLVRLIPQDGYDDVKKAYLERKRALKQGA